MYSIGDAVAYGTFGICKVTAIEKHDFSGKEKDYYILRHINSDKNTFYVPMDSEAALEKMHPICSKAEAEELISHMDSEEVIRIDNDILRKEEFSRIIKDADRHKIIRLIKTLYLRRRELAESGKKLRSTDELYLSLAENMLFDEFAYALDIGRDEVAEYIEKHIA